MATSPCNNDCRLESGVCASCGRTRQDVALWGSMTEEQRKERMRELGYNV